MEVPNGINNGEIQENDCRPGRENHGIVEEYEQTSQEETEVREEDENLRELFQAHMEGVTTTTKHDIVERERLMKAKLSEKIEQKANRIMANYLRDKNS